MLNTRRSDVDNVHNGITDTLMRFFLERLCALSTVHFFQRDVACLTRR